MAINKPIYGLKSFIIGPKVIPTSLTSEIAVNCYIEEFRICNTTGSAITILLEDNQTIPIVVLPTLSLAANSIITGDFHNLIINTDMIPGTYMPSGFSWQAGSAGLHGYVYGWTS